MDADIVERLMAAATQFGTLARSSFGQTLFQGFDLIVSSHTPPKHKRSRSTRSGGGECGAGNVGVVPA